MRSGWGAGGDAAGQRYVERISASKLTALGLTDLIATSREEYLEKALALAQNPTRRRELRNNLRSIMARSPLCDGTGWRRRWKPHTRPCGNAISQRLMANPES